MKSLLFLLTFAGLAVAAPVERFYLGTYPGGPLRDGIYTGTLDSRTGKLGKLELAATNAANFLALTANGKYLYANTSGKVSDLLAYRVEPDGRLAWLNQLPSGNGTCHVSVDAAGVHVFVANYSGGDVVSFVTTTNGSLNSRDAVLHFEGSGPNPKRQNRPYLHATYLDSGNRHLYACDLGTDSLWIFDFDGRSGKLTPATPPSAKVPPGSGPRHLAFSPDEKYVYVNGEMGLNVTAFGRAPDTGTLTAVQTVSTLPPDAETNSLSTAEIFCHPSGKWLYVSNRDSSGKGNDSLAVFAIGKDGRLTRVQNSPAQVKVPRGFGLDPSGQWLIVGGQMDHKLAVHKIDAVTGQLSFTGQTAEVNSPVCVIFAPDSNSRR